MEYWEMDIWKVNDVHFLNEEVEELMSRWNQNLVNIRSPTSLKQKTFEYCSWDINRSYIQFFICTWLCVRQPDLNVHMVN